MHALVLRATLRLIRGLSVGCPWAMAPPAMRDNVYICSLSHRMMAGRRPAHFAFGSWPWLAVQPCCTPLATQAVEWDACTLGTESQICARSPSCRLARAGVRCVVCVLQLFSCGGFCGSGVDGGPRALRMCHMALQEKGARMHAYLLACASGDWCGRPAPSFFPTPSARCRCIRLCVVAVVASCCATIGVASGCIAYVVHCSARLHAWWTFIGAMHTAALGVWRVGTPGFRRCTYHMICEGVLGAVRVHGCGHGFFSLHAVEIASPCRLRAPHGFSLSI